MRNMGVGFDSQREATTRLNENPVISTAKSPDVYPWIFLPSKNAKKAARTVVKDKKTDGQTGSPFPKR